MTIVIDFKNYDLLPEGKIKVRLKDKTELILKEKDVTIYPFSLHDMVNTKDGAGFIEEVIVKENDVEFKVLLSNTEERKMFGPEELKRMKE